jgi:hypothetical protein
MKKSIILVSMLSVIALGLHTALCQQQLNIRQYKPTRKQMRELENIRKRCCPHPKPFPHGTPKPLPLIACTPTTKHTQT